MNGSELVSRAMKAAGETSVRAFAKRLEVSHTAVQHWLDGTNVPTFEQAAEMADMAGLHPVRTAADVRLHSKDGAKHRALLRRLAHAAAIAFLALGLMPAKAAQVMPEQSQAIGIMRNRIRQKLAQALRFIRTFVTDQCHGTPALLA